MNLFYAAYLPEFLKHLLFPIFFLSTILLAWAARGPERLLELWRHRAELPSPFLSPSCAAVASRRAAAATCYAQGHGGELLCAVAMVP